MKIADLIVRAGLAESKSKARTLVEQGGFRMADIRITDPVADVFFFDEDKKWVVVENTRVLEFEANGDVFETERKSDV